MLFPHMSLSDPSFVPLFVPKCISSLQFSFTFWHSVFPSPTRLLSAFPFSFYPSNRHLVLCPSTRMSIMDLASWCGALWSRVTVARDPVSIGGLGRGMLTSTKMAAHIRGTRPASEGRGRGVLTSTKMAAHIRACKMAAPTFHPQRRTPLEVETYGPWRSGPAFRSWSRSLLALDSVVEGVFYGRRKNKAQASDGPPPWSGSGSSWNRDWQRRWRIRSREPAVAGSEVSTEPAGNRATGQRQHYAKQLLERWPSLSPSVRYRLTG
ncbi:uncharacterized protein LOC132378690 [Hypanus sabinus]|uniref:uncharacterized protein LOC132378690 n=1 Tax=Hypanus sabinus TaxID=79690 RepID=UPI0028C39ECA|nr:uncharacterized protein LOC132378690 [Hypanus sabinus]